MRYSKLFGKTKLTAPHDANSVNARYLTQAGFIDRLAAGIYHYLPLGHRVLTKINQIIREEMNAIDGQEILMPALQPIDIWDKTGRSRTMADILFKTKGASGKDFVYGASHEEAVTPLAASFVQSYNDLPFSVYQIQTKFRNEPRAKSGILRGREFGMKDMYSFHKDEADLDAYYERVIQAYLNVYGRCGVKAYLVEASGGVFSDKYSHEFSVETAAGEDTIIVCKKCGIAQNLEVAEGIPFMPESEEEELPMKEIAVERGVTVEANAKAHGVPIWKILKSVIYKTPDGLIGVVIRGDLQIDEQKLSRFLQKPVKTLSPDEIKDLGLAIGYISPVGEPKVRGGLLHAAEVKVDHELITLPFVADNSIKSVKNFATGANQHGVDLINVNLGRDFTISEMADLAAVGKNFKCKKCHSELHEVKAVEAGNIFRLGTKFSKDCDLYFTDNDGKRKLVQIGCYGIGTTRLVGTIVEASHDDKGIIWPKSVAPYLVHLVQIGQDEQLVNAANDVYAKLQSVNEEILFDDRDESAGKKFNDADLIGIPLRIVISNRTIKDNAVEWKLRTEKEGKMVPIAGLTEMVLNWIKE